MPTDKTMPPGDAMDSSTSMPGEMGGMPPEGAGMPMGQGDVMLSIPKAEFDMLHQIVMQLADGLNQMAQSLNAQGPQMQPPAGESAGMSMPMEGAAPQAKVASRPKAGGASASSADDEFLKSLMAEGNSKSR